MAYYSFHSHGSERDFALFLQLAFANRLFPSSSTLEPLCVVNKIAGFLSCGCYKAYLFVILQVELALSMRLA